MSKNKRFRMPEDWQSVLVLCLRKKAFEKTMLEFRKKNAFSRFASRIAGLVPKDPSEGVSSEDLATAYVQRFNRKEGLGTRIELDNGCTIHAVMRWQVEDRLPVLTVTYYEDGVAYVDRRHFLDNGCFERLPVPYPVSEFGVTGLPSRSDVPILARTVKKIDNACVEITRLINSVH